MKTFDEIIHSLVADNLSACCEKSFCVLRKNPSPVAKLIKP